MGVGAYLGDYGICTKRKTGFQPSIALLKTERGGG